MAKLFIVLLLILFPFTANATQTLNKQIVESFYKVTEKFDDLGDKYKETFDIADKFSMSESKKIIEHLKKSDAYKDIKSILSSHNFKSLEDFFEISYQLMGSMYDVQISRMPTTIDLDAVDKMMMKNIENMKRTGVSADIIASMEKDLKEQRSVRDEMKFASKKATSENKKFVKDNFEWLMSILPNDGFDGDDEFDDSNNPY